MTSGPDAGNPPNPPNDPNDPEETAPFATPWSSPSGADPTAPVPPPQTTPYPAGPESYQPYQPPLAPVPEPTYGGPPVPAYGGPPVPAYGYQPQAYLYAGRSHGQATTALWLGITGIAGAVLTPFCCITLPLLVCSPIAWGLGASARRSIDATPPGTWSNRGQAQAGFVLGIIGSALGLLAILGVVLLFGFVFAGI